MKIKAGIKRIGITLAAMTMLLTVMCQPLLSMPVLAEPAATEAETPATTLDVSKVESTQTEYSTYLNKNKGAAKYKGAAITLQAAEATTDRGEMAEVEGKTAANVDAGGYISWTLPAITDGLYAVKVIYASQMTGSSEYTLRLLVNGKEINRQAALLRLPKLWIQPDNYDKLPDRNFELDQFGNELASVQEEMQGWQTRYLMDSEGKYSDELLFHLQAGDTLALHVKTGDIAIAGVELTAAPSVPSYKTVKKQYKEQGYKQISGDAAVVQAELPLYTSDSSLLSTSDHMSVATQPQDASHTLQNTIGQTYWQYAGQAITWQIDVKKSGLYKLNLRYRQNYQRGVRISRRILIDDMVPFKELENYQFEFSDSWEMEELGNEKEPYLFYLEEGSHTITMQVVLAYPELIREMEAAMKSLNAFYRQVLMIVGSDPDPNRDYMLSVNIPGFEDSLKHYEKGLSALIDKLYKNGFEAGGNIVAAEEVRDMLLSYIEEPEEIPVRLSTFKDALASLGNWLSELSHQPLELDYLAAVPAKEATLDVGGGFFKELVYGFQVFLASFTGDYSSISTAEGEEALTVWVNNGRDQAQVMKRLTSTSFTSKYDIPVSISLVLQGLIPATLSGKGPDIAIGITSTDAVNLAVRDALVNLKDFQGGDDVASFQEVTTWFQPTSLDLYTYEDMVYALPVEEQFNMMFVRTDILEELGLKAPTTWEEMNNTISILTRNYLEVGIPTNPGAGLTAGSAGAGAVNESIFQTLLFQRGGTYYENGWEKTGFDSTEAIAAFTQWTEYFTKYTLPTDYDLFSRFRSGQMPVALVSYIFYNILSAGAPEIRGLWEMLPIPGTVKEDGTIDSSVAGGSSSIVMFQKTKNKENGWKFLQWFVGVEAQTSYSRQIESILGPSGRYDPSNVEALKGIGWDETVEKQILAQWSQMKMVPMTPVSYYLSRSLTNAFRKVTYSYTNPRETLNKYNREINKEIVRKRENMGLL